MLNEQILHLSVVFNAGIEEARTGHDVLKKREVLESQRIKRCSARRGLGARRRKLGTPTERQCAEERAKTLEQAIDKCGCHCLRVAFRDEVEFFFKSVSQVLRWTKTQGNQGTKMGGPSSHLRGH